MSVLTSESITEVLDVEFDLDIRIDELDPTDNGQIHKAIQTNSGSCSGCCPTNGCSYGCNYSDPGQQCLPYPTF